MSLHSPLHPQIAALLPRLRRFARALTLHREDADDVVQLAIERAMGGSTQWKLGTRVDSWMFRIIKNAWIDEVRARPRREHPFALEEAGEADEQVNEQSAMAHRQRLAVRKAIGLLSEDHRIIVGLVLVDGLPYKEAAAVLDIPLGTLMSRLARAREALQGLLSDQARNLA